MAPQFDPSLSFRGFQPNTPPLLGSSNMSTALTGRWAEQLANVGNMFPVPGAGAVPSPVATPQGDLGYTIPKGLSPQGEAEFIRAKEGEKSLYGMLGYMNDPARQKQQLDNALAYAKAQGDQQMRYRMQNDIVANLGQAAKAAFSRYSDPTPIANMIANSGAAYAEGARGASNLAQLGAGQPAVKYFNV